MRILIVDDDVELAGLLEFALTQSGFDVITAFDGEHALREYTAGNPDLVVLDVNLPRRDGFEVLGEIRRMGSTPVMMLTVRAEEQDEIRGLDLGADDYLRKPFSPRTLLARIRALLRRGGDPDEELGPAAGPLQLDPDRLQARVNEGPRFRISVLELRLLQLLLKQRGKPVVTERLLGYVWSDRDVPDREALKQLIHRLRQKLANAGGNPQWIQSVPGTGYLISLEDDEEAPTPPPAG